jgi:hypothetical protein
LPLWSAPREEARLRRSHFTGTPTDQPGLCRAPAFQPPSPHPRTLRKFCGTASPRQAPPVAQGWRYSLRRLHGRTIPATAGRTHRPLVQRRAQHPDAGGVRIAEAHGRWFCASHVADGDGPHRPRNALRKRPVGAQVRVAGRTSSGQLPRASRPGSDRAVEAPRGTALPSSRSMHWLPAGHHHRGSGRDESGGRRGHGDRSDEDSRRHRGGRDDERGGRATSVVVSATVVVVGVLWSCRDPCDQRRPRRGPVLPSRGPGTVGNRVSRASTRV